jgi:pentatricopeptide repeat protein
VAATTLLKACAQSGDGDKALMVLQRCRAEGVDLDQFAYFKVQHTQPNIDCQHLSIKVEVTSMVVCHIRINLASR